jgi:hypothetical protein
MPLGQLGQAVLQFTSGMVRIQRGLTQKVGPLRGTEQLLPLAMNPLGFRAGEARCQLERNAPGYRHPHPAPGFYGETDPVGAGTTLQQHLSDVVDDYDFFIHLNHIRR